ncbi:Xaa-Pro dipeptidase [Corynebacterium capitovis DSM 44611]|uniref:aminopeptidase P family protein n=1 Tax=Corynebacterium capitovis TaxID=131081 RepID=UPI00039A952C|nr:aminopeptidase P family protein [Corynebacterium capitovis]WKD57584.1 Xaa-Pro dipeptidase [Corynebacterium capitovis DSM 44611]
MGMADTRFETRRRTLASTLAAKRIDDMVVTNLIHVRYLSGYSGSNGALLVSKDRTARIATDGRYITQIAQEVPDIEATITREVANALLGTVVDGHRVGYEADHVTVSQLESLQAACPEGVTLVPVSGVIEGIRLTKDATEVSRLEDVAQLGVEALQGLLNAGELRAGRTERQVAADLEYRMRTLGSERVSFDTIVASGPNSAMPHHGASDRVIEQGDLVTIDFGAHRRGYNSDMTRTFAVGEIDPFLREIYDVVKASQAAGMAAARPGAALVDVDKACRSLIEDAGYGEYFVHSTGHGVGLEVHEAPYAATSGTGELEEGMTLTIEPGIYVPGRGGVRIEDTLVITAGAPRAITEWTRELVTL